MLERFKKLLLCSLALLILLPNLWAIAKPCEDWPYTPAPMFAHYIDEHTPRYSFRFEGVFSDGSTKELWYHSIGAQWPLMRFFFKYIYGSVDQRSPFVIFPHDTKREFEARLSKFFKAFAKSYTERNPDSLPLSSIRLSVLKIASGSSEGIDPHLVGTFDAGSATFHHNWKEAQ